MTLILVLLFGDFCFVLFGFVGFFKKTYIFCVCEYTVAVLPMLNCLGNQGWRWCGAK